MPDLHSLPGSCRILDGCVALRSYALLMARDILNKLVQEGVMQNTPLGPERLATTKTRIVAETSDRSARTRHLTNSDL